VEIIDGSLRMSRGAEDRAFVVAEDLEPTPDIGRVVFPDFGREIEIGTEKGGAQLGQPVASMSSARVAPLPR
jgi:hypothetical protein